MVCHRCHLASIVTRPSVYDDMIMNDNDIVIKYVMVWICFAYITYTVYSSCLHTVLHGYKFTNHNNWHLFQKRQEGGRERESERERERDRERERAREIETKRKLLLEHGLIVGGGSLCLGLPGIYIYTYFCVYVVLLSSWFVVVSSIMFIVRHTKEKTYICIYSWCICKYNIIYSRWIQVTCTF